MTQQNDTEYYVRRAKAARELADRAVDARIKAIHMRMARDYKELAEAQEKPVMRVVI